MKTLNTLSLMTALALSALSVQSASADQLYPLYSGQSISYAGYTFSCNAAPAPTPVPALEPTECTATITVTLPGYLNNRPTVDVPIVGDSPNSKLEALQNLRANCFQSLQSYSSTNLQQTCSSLAEGDGAVTCKKM